MMQTFSSQAPLELVVSKKRWSYFQTISQALALACNGTTIRVKPGLYKENIIINKPVKIVGDGSAKDVAIEGLGTSCLQMQTTEAIVKNVSLLAKRTSVGDNFQCVISINEGNLVLENCFITTSVGVGVKVENSGTIILKKSKVYGGPDAGIKFDRGASGIVEDCQIYNHRLSNIIVSHGSEAIIRRCQIHDSEKSGIWIAENSKVIVEECNIFANAYPGIGITSEAKSKILKCKIYNGTNGILITNGGQGLIENCEIYGNTYPGIAITSGSNPVVKRCKIYNGTNGISIAENGQGLIENCEIYGNTYPGVAINSGGNPVIKKCQIYGGKSYGILVTDKGQGIIDSCEIYDNKDKGISITSEADPTIINCNIYGEKQGIAIAEKGKGLIENCSVFANKAGGISITLEADPVIKKSKIYDNKGNGISVKDNGKGVIEDCEIVGNADLAISLDSQDNTIVKNCKVQNGKSLNILLQELDSLVGLSSVKQVVKEIVDTEIANQRLRTVGMKVDQTETRHMVFIGNPGTGKTTVASLMGEIFKELGVLKKGQFVEVRRDLLVGQYQGHTAKLTAAAVRSALDGILFVDEAYALIQGENDEYGREAVNTLISLMENYRQRTIVIFAGYAPQMRQLINSNPGLESRIAYQIEFSDYTGDEMQQIFLSMCENSGWICSPDLSDYLVQVFANIYTSRDENFANARNVRNLFEAMVRRLKSRIVRDNLSGEKMLALSVEDIPPEYKIASNLADRENLESLLQELDSLIGLDSVKITVRELINTQLANQRLLEAGHQIHDSETRHMLFTGNPGTGKTTVARLIGRIFKALGLLRKGGFYEVNRTNLVGQYQGQTAIKTKQGVELALDGVLFLDEAYALNNSDRDTYGIEAIDTLVPLLEKYRDRLVVIFAGYSREMQYFLSVNSGLESRIAYKIEFPDYTGEQLHQIFLKMAEKDGWIVPENVSNLLKKRFLNWYHNRRHNFANAREVRNLYEKMVRSLKTRIVEDNLPQEEMRKFAVTDLPFE